MFVKLDSANIYVMSKRSTALESMPSAVQAQLRELGENLCIARKRRRETRKAWAERIGVSEPTVMRMEKGDPSVSMGIYATALWLMGRATSLPGMAAPEHDQAALEDAVRVAKSRAVRKPASIYGVSHSVSALPSQNTVRGTVSTVTTTGKTGPVLNDPVAPHQAVVTPAADPDKNRRAMPKSAGRKP
jgi:DNA-binding XRE family transcriptional regulator